MDKQILWLFAFIYVFLLFFVAWLAQRWNVKNRWYQPLLYSFSLAIYCSSWTFLGAVGRAVESGWNYLSIYLGPILVFIFGWRFLRRLLLISARNKVTSIADFIGSRYGKSQVLAAAVTLLAVAGSLPYIALQLKAVSMVWSTMNIELAFSSSPLSPSSMSPSGTSIITIVIMAWFAILFGTRAIEGPHRHQGVIAIIAMESIVKLIAFFAISVLAFTVLNRADFSAAFSSSALSNFGSLDLNFFTQMLLSMMAIICLPRQFHVMAVEYRNSRDIRTARWVFPIYLLLFSVLIVPIVLAGQQLFVNTNVSTDTYVLLLPIAENNPVFIVLAFIGALSAATGMVMVAAVTLSIMISNELIVPLWLWLNARVGATVSDLGEGLKLVRRISIVLLLLLAWWMDLSFSQVDQLSAIGLISFAGAAQLMPAICASMYWDAGHRNGVLAGLLLGGLLWFYCLLLPALLGDQHTLVVHGPSHIAWLSPVNIFGSGFLDALSHGVFWSLLINCLVFYGVSKCSRFNALDLRQVQAFMQLRCHYHFRQKDFELTDIDVRQLQMLLRPLLGDVRDHVMWNEFEQRLGHRLLPHDKAPRFVVQAVEESMGSIIGAVSAHQAIELTSRQLPVQIDDFVSIMGGRSRQLQFSQELLQTTLETIPQGISVVDEYMQLVAWNSRYQELFNFPARLLYVGCPIAKVYRYNAERGYLGSSDDKNIDEAIARRLGQLGEAKPYRFERRLVDGRVVEILGTPIANGGYVTTYTDISNYHQVLDELEQAKTRLEERVAERTAELSQANKSLLEENSLRARIEHELKIVHASKSRFLAAASHDLLQPINAARLFVATLQQKIINGNIDTIDGDVNHIDGALASAENLIESMREIARLDSGKLTLKREHFPIATLLAMLAGEFSVLAKLSNIQFHWVNSQQWVYTDQHLLRRVLQNFLSNALAYTRRGKVLLGCRRRNDELILEVWDTGFGIAQRDRGRIFEEFERLASSGVGCDEHKGLGLGLSIANRIAQLLGHKLDFDSQLGVGSVFRITIPLGKVHQIPIQNNLVSYEMKGIKVLCIDNELRILAGMQALLEQWGCQVICATTLGEALQRWQDISAPDIVLADYHLDAGEQGLNVLQALTYHWGCSLPAIVISANNSNEIDSAVKQAGYLFLAKPVQPGALRGSMRRLLRNSQSFNP